MQLAIQTLAPPFRLSTERPMTDDELIRFSLDNELLRIEQESNGDLLVMSPPGTEGSGQNADLVGELHVWARQDGRGKVFDSNTEFRLADQIVRAADVAWVSWEQWNALTREQQRRYAPICPEFVIELRSPSGRLGDLRAKMTMWLASGALLGWLPDPERKAVEIYRPGQEPEVSESAHIVHGEGPVAGFHLELARLWP